jgi:hypothetical protein
MDGPASNSHGTGIVPLVRIRARSRGEGGAGGAAAEAFRNILNRCDKGWVGTWADVSGRVYLLPCHCQVPLCGESWGRRGRWWVREAPAGRSLQWAGRPGPRVAVSPHAAHGAGGGSPGLPGPGLPAYASDERSTSFLLPCRGAALALGMGRAGPDRACWDVALRLGLYFFFCPVLSLLSS